MGLVTQALWTPDFEQLALDTFDIAPDEVRARISWAAHRGQPQWLWPDVDVHGWHEAQEQIARVASDVLVHGCSVQPLDGIAAAIGVAGYTSGMGPLLGHWLEVGQVTAGPAVAALLELQLRHNRLRMERMATHAAAIGRVLADAGVAHTVLKGMHTAYRYFQEPGTRPLSDIDLLIAPFAERRASDALYAAGFRQQGALAWPPERWWQLAGSPEHPRSLCFVHVDDPWVVDVHTSLNRRFAAGSPIVRMDDAAAGVVRQDRAPSPHAQGLPQPALLLHLAVHASCGFASLTLLRMVELMLVIRKDFGTDPACWDSYLAAANATGVPGFTYPALKMCNDLVPGTVPTEVLAELRQDLPGTVARVVDPLSPANAQQLLRSSLREHFMWAPSAAMAVRQFLSEIVPSDRSSLTALVEFGRTRLRRLMYATMAR